jgi:hypothetical protein
MSTAFDWDQYKGSSDWITFEQVGDKVVGTIKTIRVGSDFKGNPCPELVIDIDGEGEKTLTAGQKVLKTLLAEKRPNVGDRIAIVYSGVGDAQPGKAPAKLFDVSVKPGTATTGVSADDLLPADDGTQPF